MTTGMSTDEVKTRLKSLQAKIDQHQRAVDDATRDHGDNVATRDYGVEWINFKKKVADLTSDADAWTAVTTMSAVENAEREFGIVLTNFETLAQKLSLARGAEKIKALEAIITATPKAKEDFKKDGQVKLRTDATPIPVPVPVPVPVPDPKDKLPSWVIPVTGLGGLLFLLKKIFLG